MENNGARNFIRLEDRHLFESNLRDTLMGQLPASAKILNMLEIYQQKYYSIESINFEFWSYETDDDTVTSIPQRDWSCKAQPLFIVIIMNTNFIDEWPWENGRIYRTMYSRDKPPAQSIPKFVNLIKDAEAFEFGTIEARCVEFMENLATFTGKECKVNYNWTMYLPMDKWKDFLLSEVNISHDDDDDVEVRKLEQTHAEIVNSHWKFGAKGPEGHAELSKCIIHGVSAGVFKNNVPISWVISLPIGTFNALHTTEGHRRQGHAETTIRFACREAIQRNLFPLCEIEFISEASKNLFQKLGFQEAFRAAWIFFK